jgi:hypothetical protein
MEMDGADGVAQTGAAGPAGFAGAAGFNGSDAAGGAATVAGGLMGVTAAGAAGAAEIGVGAGGTTVGLLRAAFAAASFACDSDLALTSAASSAAEALFNFARTLTATSSGIELECVFFSVTP